MRVRFSVGVGAPGQARYPSAFVTAPPTPGARPAGRSVALAIALLALLAAVVLPGRADAAQAPRDFFGVHPLHPVPGDYGRMADADVGMIRTGFAHPQWQADHHLLHLNRPH